MLLPSAVAPAAAAAGALASTASSLAPQFVQLCSHLAPPMSVLLSAAPMPTIRQIQADKDVGSLPLLPYSCMAANCGLWTTYGLLKRNTSIWAPNLVGFLLALYYCKSFIKFAPKQSPTLPGSVRLHVTSLLTVGAAVAAAVLSSVNPALMGQAAVVFCIALFASPLSTLKTVLQTKSAQSIPLPFTLASVAACLCWSVAGVWKMKDLNVIIPNALGLLCGLAQVALKLTYGNRDPQLLPAPEQPQEGYALATP